MKRTFRELLIARITKRVELLEKRLGKYTALKQELDECKETLKVMSVSNGGVAPTKINDPADLCYEPSNQTPLSIDGLKIFDSLPIQFDVNLLQSKLNNDKPETYQWIAAWKRSNKIRTHSRGVYQKN